LTACIVKAGREEGMIKMTKAELVLLVVAAILVGVQLGAVAAVILEG
jgi:hypothetical protein